MFKIVSAKHAYHVRASVLVSGVPEGKRVQVFVYSFRSGFWYSQSTPIDGQTTVYLGNNQHKHGHYGIIAVALDQPAVWGRRSCLPDGEQSNTLHVHRHAV
jgi:hypothetical protein